MSESVELSSLDLRYEGYRLRDEARETGTHQGRTGNPTADKLRDIG